MAEQQAPRVGVSPPSVDFSPRVPQRLSDVVRRNSTVGVSTKTVFRQQYLDKKLRGPRYHAMRIWLQVDTMSQFVASYLSTLYAIHAVAWEVAQAVIGAVTFALCVFVSYKYKNVPSSKVQALTIAFRVVTLLFAIDLVMRNLMATTKWRYFFSIANLLDIAVIIPTLFLEHTTKGFYLLISLRFLSTERILSALEIQATLGKSRLLRQSRLIWRVARLFYIVVMILCIAAFWVVLLEPDVFDSFHDGLYFAVVTVTTVGYGDLSPITVLGQVAVMIMIFFSMLFVPAHISSLNDAYIEMTSKRLGNSEDMNQPFVLIVGGFDADAVRMMVGEFFSDPHEDLMIRSGIGAKGFKLKFMAPGRPSDQLKACFLDPYLADRIQYLVGDPASTKDLLMANAKSAAAVLVASDNPFDQSWAESDARTIMYVVRIRALCPNVPVFADVYTPETRAILTLHGAQCLSFNKARGFYAGRSLFCQGFATLLMNLMDSTATVTKTGPEWLKLYTQGQAMNIFAILFPQRFEGRSFKECARDIYTEENIILIAIYKHDQNQHLVADEAFMPPTSFGQYFVNPGCDVSVEAGDIGIVVAPRQPTAFPMGVIAQSPKSREPLSPRRRRASTAFLNALVHSQESRKVVSDTRGMLVKHIKCTDHVLIIGSIAFSNSLLRAIRIYRPNADIVFLVDQKPSKEDLMEVAKKFEKVLVVVGSGASTRDLRRVNVARAQVIYLRRTFPKATDSTWTKVVDPVLISLALSKELGFDHEKLVVMDTHKTQNGRLFSQVLPYGAGDASMPISTYPGVASGRIINFEYRSRAATVQYILKPFLGHVFNPLLYGQTVHNVVTNNRTCTMLVLVDIPTEFARAEYEKLALHFFEQGDIPLGLLRGRGVNGARTEWVLTHPDRQLLVNSLDKIFVIQTTAWEK